MSVKRAREVLALLKEGTVFEDVRFVGDSKPHKLTKVLEEIQRGRKGFTNMRFVDEAGRKIYVEDRGFKVKNALVDPSEGDLAVFVMKDVDTGAELKFSTRRDEGTAYLTKVKFTKGTEPSVVRIRLWECQDDNNKVTVEPSTPKVD
jgi:hypothetical protein